MGFSKSKSEHTSKKIRQFILFYFIVQSSFIQLCFMSCETCLTLAKLWEFTFASTQFFLFFFNFSTLCHLNPVVPLSPNNSFIQTDIDTSGVVDSNRLMVEDPFMWAQWPQNIPEHHYYVQTDNHECILLKLFPNFNYIQTPIASIHEYLIPFLIFPLIHPF